VGKADIEFTEETPKLLLVKSGAINRLVGISDGKKEIISINISELEKEKGRYLSRGDIVEEISKFPDKADYITIYDRSVSSKRA